MESHCDHSTLKSGAGPSTPNRNPSPGHTPIQNLYELAKTRPSRRPQIKLATACIGPLLVVRQLLQFRTSASTSCQIIHQATPWQFPAQGVKATLNRSMLASCTPAEPTLALLYKARGNTAAVNSTAGERACASNNPRTPTEADRTQNEIQRDYNILVQTCRQGTQNECA